MNPEIRRTLKEMNTNDWKEIPVEYGREILAIRVPPNCDILTMKEIPVLPDPGRPSRRPFRIRSGARLSKRSSVPRKNRQRSLGLP